MSAPMLKGSLSSKDVPYRLPPNHMGPQCNCLMDPLCRQRHGGIMSCRLTGPLYYKCYNIT